MNPDRPPAWKPFPRRAVPALPALLLLAAGCALLPGRGGRPTAEGAAAPSRPAAAYAVESRSVEGRRIRCFVLGRGPGRVLFLAGFHGDEPAGPRLCRRLCDELRRRPALLEGRQVLVVPVLNPDGRARGTRFNARGVDLNRNFDTANRRETRSAGPVPLSEPETRFAAALVRVFRPACIVSIHQPLGCVDWDGPARGAAEVLARACGLPVKKLGARPGSLGSFAGVDLGLPVLTLELPAAASPMDGETLWRTYGPALLAALRFAEGIPPDPSRFPSIEKDTPRTRDGEAVDRPGGKREDADRGPGGAPNLPGADPGRPGPPHPRRTERPGEGASTTPGWTARPPFPSDTCPATGKPGGSSPTPRPAGTCTGR